LARKRFERDWGKAVPWVALAIALYGAVLSTVQWRDSRAEKERRLDVSLAFGSPVAKGRQFPTGLEFKAENPGYQIVHVAAGGLFLPDGSILWFGRGTGDWQFPKDIGPGGNAGILWVSQDLATLCDSLIARGLNGTVTLTGFCQDGLGKFHKSEPLEFSIDDARKLARAQIEGAKSEDSGGTRRAVERFRR